MKDMAYTMARKGIGHELEERNTAFSLWFIGIFTVSFVFLYTIDVVPDPTARWENAHGGVAVATAEGAEATYLPASRAGNNAENSAAALQTQGQMPVRIVIDEIGLNATVGNPDTTDDAVLNQFLKAGAVRYPTSSILGVNGTVVLFGHSSYLPVVANEAFRTFTDIQKLRKGDSISVYSSDREYRYSVTGVSKVRASDGIVALPSDGQYLTLVTCDSFNKVLTDRWVVESKLVGIYSLAS